MNRPLAIELADGTIAEAAIELGDGTVAPVTDGGDGAPCCCEPGTCLCTTGQMCALYAEADLFLAQSLSIPQLCGPTGLDQVAGFQWAGGVNGYLSLGRRFEIRMQHDWTYRSESSNDGDSDDTVITLSLRCVWTLAQAPSASMTQADLVAELGETPDPDGWRTYGVGMCFYATLLEPIVGTYTRTTTRINDGGEPDVEEVHHDINGYLADLPSDLVDVRVWYPDQMVRTQPNGGQVIMPLDRDGFAWSPFQLQGELLPYTSLRSAVTDPAAYSDGSTSTARDVTFPEFTTITPGGPEHFGSCQQALNFARLAKSSGAYSRVDGDASHTLTFAAEYGTEARQAIDWRLAWKPSPDEARLEASQEAVTADLVVLEACPPGSGIDTLPPIDCNQDQGPHRVAYPCVAEPNVPDIAIDPMTEPNDGQEYQTVIYEGRRYVVSGTTTAAPAVDVLWSTDPCRTVRLAPPCDPADAGPAHPYLEADVPAGAQSFRVGERVFRVAGPQTSRLSEVVDEWMTEPCPNGQGDWMLMRRCPGRSYPAPISEFARYPANGNGPGSGYVIYQYPRPGCSTVVRYEALGTPTSNLSLPEGVYLDEPPCLRPDLTVCGPDNPIPPDIIGDPESPLDPEDNPNTRALRAEHDRRLRQRICFGCGDGLDGL